MEMETELVLWSMVAIVGTVGIIKNLINKGNKFIWTAITIVVGIGIGLVAVYCPITVLQVWVAVTGATLFYDTVIKAFQKFIEKIAKGNN